MVMKLVYLTDSKIPYEEAEEYFQEAADWAKQNCKTFISHTVQDVSDFSHEYDHISEYRFNDIKDATWFKLRWL
jgi:hypothetical protein